MILEFLKLYWIFFKVGLFAIGGGLAAIPLIQDEVVARGWLTTAQFTDMIAVSESTPGPIGVNVATYVGFSQYGILGSLIATFGIVTPSVIIIMIVAKFIMKYRDNKYVDGMFKGIRPAVTGLILSAAVTIALISLFDLTKFAETDLLLDLFNFKAIIMFAVFFFVSNKWKHHPIFYITAAGIIGILIF
jgi:chromate transporter